MESRALKDAFLDAACDDHETNDELKLSIMNRLLVKTATTCKGKS
jgi:hypothetical protein